MDSSEPWVGAGVLIPKDFLSSESTTPATTRSVVCAGPVQQGAPLRSHLLFIVPATCTSGAHRLRFQLAIIKPFLSTSCNSSYKFVVRVFRASCSHTESTCETSCLFL